MKKLNQTTILLLSTGAIAVAGCDAAEAGSGDLSVLVEAEDTILEGLDPGDGPEDIRDGWQVRFSKYVIVIGDIDLHLSTDENVRAEAGELFAVDLTKVPAAGLGLWEIPELQAGRWAFAYSTAHAGEAKRHESVDEADFTAMGAADFTYWISATLTNPSGVSCPPPSKASIPSDAVAVSTNAAGHDCFAATSVAFEIGAEAETAYGPCEIDGTPGVSIPDGGTQTVAATIHGDHLFFNGFPEGGEGGTLRLAQWWADSDLDLDGTVTQAELEAISPSDLVELDDRYQLGGSPITPLANMYDYVRAQLKTQGHFQGEGECPVDGVEHDHEHEDE